MAQKPYQDFNNKNINNSSTPKNFFGLNNNNSNQQQQMSSTQNNNNNNFAQNNNRSYSPRPYNTAINNNNSGIYNSNNMNNNSSSNNQFQNGQNSTSNNDNNGAHHQKSLTPSAIQSNQNQTKNQFFGANNNSNNINQFQQQTRDISPNYPNNKNNNNTKNNINSSQSAQQFAKNPVQNNNNNLNKQHYNNFMNGNGQPNFLYQQKTQQNQNLNQFQSQSKSPIAKQQQQNNNNNFSKQLSNNSNLYGQSQSKSPHHSNNNSNNAIQSFQKTQKLSAQHQQQQQQKAQQQQQQPYHFGQQLTNRNNQEQQGNSQKEKEAELMYGYSSQKPMKTQPSNNNNSTLMNQQQQQQKGKNLDSFSHITGSILDEGVNTNIIPAARTITGSKQPLYSNNDINNISSNNFRSANSKSPYGHNNGKIPNLSTQTSAIKPTFFTNFDNFMNKGNKKSNGNYTPTGSNNNYININNNTPRQQSQQQQFNGNNNTNQNNNSNNNSDANPFLIKNKDTGQVYDLREYSKIKDEDEAHRYFQNNNNNNNNTNLNQSTQRSVSPYNTLNDLGIKSKSKQQQQNQQQQQQKYSPNKKVLNNNNNINNTNELNSERSLINNSQVQQNQQQNNNNKSLSPSPFPSKGPSYAQISLQNSHNNLSTPNNSTQQQQNNNNNTSINNNSNTSWQQLLSAQSKINNELLLMAKINNQESCIDLLDKKKRGDKRADVNSKGENDWTPLHYASLNGNAKLVSFLLYHEAIIDSPTKQNVTPLIIAAQKGFEDLFQILMTAGADINFQDINGDTSIHHATKMGNKTVIEMLLRKHSLNYKIKNNQGIEPYDISQDASIKKIYENFFQFKQQAMVKDPRLQIYNAQQEKVAKMFNSRPQVNANDKFNTDLQNNQNPKKQNSNSNNKSSINSENTTEESGAGSFNAEDKVGPQSFLVHGLIGKGSFGEVYLVEKKSNNMLYAMKVLHKNKIMRHNLTRYAMTERNVLSLTNHPFIVKMQFAFQTKDKLFLILDYCPGGDLGELLQKEKRFNEERVKIYLCEIVLALEDLHKRDVIFRDLKPDNIVLDHEGHAKLTDFGLSKEGILDPHSGARSFCGSVAYLAPEMLKRCGHGKAVDWYLLGVVMYEFLVGIPPYYANNREELFHNIEKAPLKLPASLSTDAKSLLKALLQRNPAKRLGSGKGDAEEIKQHKFFQEVNWNDVLSKKLRPPIPKRKIRISTKFDPNIFDSSGNIDNEKEKIEGWSFVAPQHINN